MSPENFYSSLTYTQNLVNIEEIDLDNFVLWNSLTRARGLFLGLQWTTISGFLSFFILLIFSC